MGPIGEARSKPRKLMPLAVPVDQAEAFITWQSRPKTGPKGPDYIFLDSSEVFQT